MVDGSHARRDAQRPQLGRVRRRDLVLGLLRGELLADLVGLERRVRPRRPRVAQVVLDAVERRKLCAGLDRLAERRDLVLVLEAQDVLGAAVPARRGPVSAPLGEPVGVGVLSTGASATSTSTSMPSVLDSEAPICLLLLTMSSENPAAQCYFVYFVDPLFMGLFSGDCWPNQCAKVKAGTH